MNVKYEDQYLYKNIPKGLNIQRNRIIPRISNYIYVSFSLLFLKKATEKKKRKKDLALINSRMVQHRTRRQVSLVFHSGAATRRNPKNKIIGSILCGAVTRRSVRAKFNTTSRIYLNTLVQATACCWLGSEDRDKRASTRPHPSFPSESYLFRRIQLDLHILENQDNITFSCSITLHCILKFLNVAFHQ